MYRLCRFSRVGETHALEDGDRVTACGRAADRLAWVSLELYETLGARGIECRECLRRTLRLGSIPSEAREIVRPTDPETSQEGAARVLPTIGEKQRATLAAVRRSPGLTATELAHLDDVRDVRAYNRRLPELLALGLVERGPKRICRVTSYAAYTWLPRDEAINPF